VVQKEEELEAEENHQGQKIRPVIYPSFISKLINIIHDVCRFKKILFSP
jgi:hypothetical protein